MPQLLQQSLAHQGAQPAGVCITTSREQQSGSTLSPTVLPAGAPQWHEVHRAGPVPRGPMPQPLQQSLAHQGALSALGRGTGAASSILSASELQCTVTGTPERAIHGCPMCAQPVSVSWPRMTLLSS